MRRPARRSQVLPARRPQRLVGLASTAVRLGALTFAGRVKVVVALFMRPLNCYRPGVGGG